MRPLALVVLLAFLAAQSSGSSLRSVVGTVKDRDIRGGFNQYRDRCTAIGVGKHAMADGSTVTTHNNDCQECDFRITHVPARTWPEGSVRPIYAIRSHYPRYLENSNTNPHGPDYLIDKVETSIHNWTTIDPVGIIPQVKKTYAYTLGTYAIQNERQVSIGESTCSAVFYARPRHDGGKALLHMETLTELGLERCATARCALQTMGDLAVKYGFYAGGYDDGEVVAQDEAGEALLVADPDETWMFHILPDDTGSSAIWLAQRIPDDHIAVVANQFVLQTYNLSDSKNFMGSSNIETIAQRAGLWDPAQGPLHFSRTFGTNRHKESHACTRRVWRVLTLAAPSLLPIFSPYTDSYATFGFGPDGDQPYPFSVKPDKSLTVQDIMNMNRDQYEGTPFDLSTGLDSGPFGDTTRYPATTTLQDSVQGVSAEQYNSGLDYQRAISLWRTAYSTVTQSRSHLPDVLGAVTWIAQYAPHHSSFVPVYANAESAPSSLNVGTQYKLDKRSNWWIHCMTGNYLNRWYRHTIDDVRAFQKRIEASIFSAQKETEARAVSLLSSKSPSVPEKMKSVVEAITQFQETAARTVRDKWWDFFFLMVSTYRDMYKIVDFHAENFNDAFTYLTVNRDWMESIGYWGVPGTPATGSAPVPVKPINVPTENSREDYARKYPNGYFSPYSYTSIYTTPALPVTTPDGPVPGQTPEEEKPVAPSDVHPAPVPPTPVSAPVAARGSAVPVVLAALIGLALGVAGTLYSQATSKRQEYEPIA